MYSKIEVALIFRSCRDTQEVIQANNAFNYLHAVADVKVPGYVYLWASLRLRTIEK